MRFVLIILVFLLGFFIGWQTKSEPIKIKEDVPCPVWADTIYYAIKAKE